MVSKQTVTAVLDIIKRYVPDPATRARLLSELGRVVGNRSFEDTMTALNTADINDEDVGGDKA